MNDNSKTTTIATIATKLVQIDNEVSDLIESADRDTREGLYGILGGLDEVLNDLDGAFGVYESISGDNAAIAIEDDHADDYMQRLASAMEQRQE